MQHFLTLLFLTAVVLSTSAADLASHQLLVTSVRTGDTEVFVAAPVTGDLFNMTRSPTSEDRYPCWSPDSKRIVYSVPVGEALELIVIHADTTGNRQLTRFGETNICTPSVWSPDGQWISFRRADERYWSNLERMRKVYSEILADKRPVWIIRPDDNDAEVIEPLRYQMAIDGSRASWKPIR